MYSFIKNKYERTDNYIPYSKVSKMIGKWVTYTMDELWNLFNQDNPKTNSVFQKPKFLTRR